MWIARVRTLGFRRNLVEEAGCQNGRFQDRRLSRCYSAPDPVGQRGESMASYPGKSQPYLRKATMISTFTNTLHTTVRYLHFTSSAKTCHSYCDIDLMFGNKSLLIRGLLLSRRYDKTSFIDKISFPFSVTKKDSDMTQQCLANSKGPRKNNQEIILPGRSRTNLGIKWNWLQPPPSPEARKSRSTNSNISLNK